MNARVKILIIRRSALGDTIHTLPLLSALKNKYPDSQIDWVVDEKASRFLINHPFLNRVYILRKQKSDKISSVINFFRTIADIRSEKYDIAIDTQQLLKSSVIMALSGAKRKIALSDGREFSYLFANEIIKSPRKQFDIHYHVVKRNLEIAGYLGADADKIEFVMPPVSNSSKIKAEFILSSLDKSRKTVVIAPETTWENKHWSEEGWRNLLNYLKEKVNIIYTGTDKDNGLSERILKGFERYVINLRGKTSLDDMREVLSYADLLISPDSGTAHIAWADGKCDIITLFFATSGERTAPVGEKYDYVQPKCPCSPCMKKKCTLKRDKNMCVLQVNSKEIIKIINRHLQFE